MSNVTVKKTGTSTISVIEDEHKTLKDLLKQVS